MRHHNAIETSALALCLFRCSGSTEADFSHCARQLHTLCARYAARPLTSSHSTQAELQAPPPILVDDSASKRKTALSPTRDASIYSTSRSTLGSLSVGRSCLPNFESGRGCQVACLSLDGIR